MVARDHRADAARRRAPPGRQRRRHRVLVTAVCWYLGPGVGLWLLLLGAPAATPSPPLFHGGDHVSVGASTATFGAIGILAACASVAGRAGAAGGSSWVVIAASLALWRLLGTGRMPTPPHLFGFILGGGLGR